jgi:hypothetical protein
LGVNVIARSDDRATMMDVDDAEYNGKKYGWGGSDRVTAIGYGQRFF